MIKNNIGKLVFGIIMLCFGILLLLINLGLIIDISFLDFFKMLWPLGIILAGLLIIFKQRLLGSIFLIISISLGIFFLILPDHIDSEMKFYSYEYENNDSINEINYYVSFGMADFKLGSLNKSNLFVVNGSSTFNTLNVDLTEDNNLTQVSIIGKEDFAYPWLLREDNQLSSINLWVNPNVKTNLNLDYGVSDAVIDLREININTLNINNGVSNTIIYFGNNPLKVNIDSGISDIKMVFVNDSQVKIQMDGGLIDDNFKDFKKIGSTYYSSNYVSGENSIEIEIDAGISSISGGFENE